MIKIRRGSTTCALSGTGNRMIYISGISHYTMARVRILSSTVKNPANVYFSN